MSHTVTPAETAAADAVTTPDVLTYTADNIQVLEGLEAVRRRPGMYIGGTDIKALHHMVYEVVDNAVDEAMAGACDRIEITIHPDESVSVADNGRGIPVGIHTQTGRSALEVVMTKLHAGGKFGGGGYKVSGGLHGVGVSAVNALSHWLVAEVRQNGMVHRQRYEHGVPQGDVQAIRPMRPDETSGTTITFLRDDTIFEETDYRFAMLHHRLREMAFLTRGVTVRLRDERVTPDRDMTFYFEGGVASFVTYLNRGRAVIHPVVYVNKEIEGTQVETAFQYTDAFVDNTYAFANTIVTPDGGVHLTGFRAAITRVINDYARKQGLLKENDTNFSGDDTREGITAVISVKVPDPQFESQTKVKLLNVEVRFHVESAVADAFAQWLDENPREGRTIVEKCLTAARARRAAKQARELVIRKSALESGSLPGKLADCSTRNPEEAELYIVEGDSAGGTAKQGRDRRFQAILPLRGKILNVEKSRLDKILHNNEVRSLIQALGVGIGDDVDLEHLRYHQAIIMSVAGDEPTLVVDELGNSELVPIGGFIDDCIEGRRKAGRYRVVSFDETTGAVRFQPLKAVIRHSHAEPMYKITTRYNRSVKVTASHSVYTYTDGKPQLTKGSAVRPGDILVASRRLPRPEGAPDRIDVLKTLHSAGLTSGLYLRGEDVRQAAGRGVLDGVQRPELWNEPRVAVDGMVWHGLVEQRQLAGLSQTEVASAIGVKQPITISHWERGINRPIWSHFVGYLRAIGWDDPADAGLAYRLIPSKVEERLAQNDDSRNARWRKVSAYKRFGSFTEDEIDGLGDDVELVPQAHVDRGFGRYLPVSRDLAWFLGWYVAEGTLSAHQVSLNLGEKDVAFIGELTTAIENLFSETPRVYPDPDSKGIKLYFHSVMAARLLRAWGLGGRAHEKKLPDMVLGWPKDLQVAFLEGYWLGDGTLSSANIVFVTNSVGLRDGLLYLLGQLGFVASMTTHQPSTKPDAPIQTRRPYSSIAICGKAQLERCRPIWQRHAGAAKIEAYLRKPVQGPMRFVPIGEDLMGLEVLSVEEVAPVGEFVYDFSVEGDENFVCGVGGLCAHNTDADVDGSHIRTLLLTFFYRFMPQLIEAGHLYIAQPPLYLIKSGKRAIYTYSDAEKDRVIAELGEGAKIGIQRYKGLGEMNSEQLWETTMDPARRQLLRVAVEDAATADRTFEMLMGAEVPPRKRFIMTHAQDVRNLDV